MFEVLRATTILGLLAAGIPALLSAQTAVSVALPSGQRTGKPAAAKPITASGFVASGHFSRVYRLRLGHSPSRERE